MSKHLFKRWLWDVFRWLVAAVRPALLTLCTSVPIVLGVIGLNDQQTFNFTSTWNAERTGWLFLLVWLGQFAGAMALYVKESPFPVPEDDE